MQGKEIIVESLEGLKSNRKINYEIKFYDKNGVELKVENNAGETRTSKEVPTAEVSIKEQDIVSVTLDLKLNDKDNANIENYKYVITKSNGDIEKEERLSKNEKKIVLDDLDQNQYYKIVIYADYDLNNNKGKQESQEIGSLIFATKPISTLGSLEIIVENKELNQTTSTVTYQINEERTDKRLIQILNEVQITIKNGENIVQTDTITGEELTKFKQAELKEIKYENLRSNRNYKIEITGNVKLGKTSQEIPVTYNYKEFITPKTPTKIEIKNKFVTGNLIEFDVRVEDINNAVLTNKVRMELRDSKNNLINLQEIATNENYIVKTYERLTENETYRISFYADQYNEGSTNATYKANYLIYELKIVTEAGISGSIGLTELTKKGTGKNLIDVTSKNEWYVPNLFNTTGTYGKEYNEETKTLTLGDYGYKKIILYNLSEYVNREITISFKARNIRGPENGVYIQNSKTNKNRIQIPNLTEEWNDFQYTLVVDESGYVGFYTNGGNEIEIQELQIELGNKKTNYEEFQYILKSNYSINLEDKRGEIATKDYYIKIYEDSSLVKTNRYEEIPEGNIITNEIKTYNVQAGKQYKVELVIKIREREYKLSELEYSTQETEEIKGIYSKEDFLEIQPNGYYIVLRDIDLNGGSGNMYRFGNDKIKFEGYIDFNGHILERDTNSSVAPIFYEISEKGVLKNLQLNIRMNNTKAISGLHGLVTKNYGTISNIQIKLIESSPLPNNNIFLLGNTNYGTIDKFILNFVEPLYGSHLLTGLIKDNGGTIQNGYCYGNNIKAIYRNTSGTTYRTSAPVCTSTIQGSKVLNVYSLVSVDTENAEGGMHEIANIIGKQSSGATIKNIYSVGIGDTYNINYGPNVYTYSSYGTVQNSYYFTDITFNSKGNQKTSLLALWDVTFQSKILNEDRSFNVNDFVMQGYYPQLNWSKCMPVQEYINLPKVEDKDLPDILSIDVLENTINTAKVKIYVNNPSAETITKLGIKNVDCIIESQEYKDGKSEIIVILEKPTLYVSQYSIINITTKGVYDREYTRDFEDKERVIDIEFYKEINTIDEWKGINTSLTENYILMQDLDFRNNPRNSYISKQHSGKIDGNNHTIRNINIDTNSVISSSNNEIKNLKFENIIISNQNALGIIGTAKNVKNVYANNIRINVTKEKSTGINGGLVGQLNNVMENCGVNNVTIINETNSSQVRIGGLVAYATGSNINNCFATNINIKTRCNTYVGVGGLIGGADRMSISNCYATGNIEIDGEVVGGLLGNGYSRTNLNNSYSYVNISGNVDTIGGIIGNFTGECNVWNNISIGNLYTSALRIIPNRIIGSGTLTGINYAYTNQRINGLTTNSSETNVKLITPEELLDKETYTNTLNYGKAYDYTDLDNNILPKLYKIDDNGVYLDELLHNQEDIYLDISKELKIESIDIEKSAVDKITGQLVVTNTKNLEVTIIEIEGMDIEAFSTITKDKKTYINITAIPKKFYDTYKITKIKYKENGIEKEQEIEGKIETQFYKDIYNFEDWQSIEIGTYQNYRLMADIDFAGRTNIKTNITVARLETEGAKHILKNITLNYSEENKGLIQEVQHSLKNIVFEKINISNTQDSTGIIIYCNGDAENIEFKEITLNGGNYTGSIAKLYGSVSNVKMEAIDVTGKDTVGGLIGAIVTGGKAEDIEANNITINGNSNIGGLIGTTPMLTFKRMQITDANIQGLGSKVGGILGAGGGLSEATVKGVSVSGIDYIGGAIGHGSGASTGNVNIEDSEITGIGKCIGGIAGYAYTNLSTYGKVIRCTITGKTVDSNYVGGIFGSSGCRVTNFFVEDSVIISLGSCVGGIAGYLNRSDTYYSDRNNICLNTKVEGYSDVGGIVGNASEQAIEANYTDAEVVATSHNAGGIVGYFDNKIKTTVSNVSKLKNNYIANGKVKGNSNVGGLIGDIAENITELNIENKYYTGNYVQADIESSDLNTASLKIGGRMEENEKLLNTYVYKYSSVNGQNPNKNNEPFILEEEYLEEEDLKKEETYKTKLGWGANYIYTTLIEGKYPILNNKNLVDQEGIDLPIDAEHIIGGIESLLEMQSLENIEQSEQNLEIKEELEQTFKYNNKTIQTYNTYSVITAEDGSQVTRNSKLYVKDNNLYALPTVLSGGQASNTEEVVPIANNLIIDSYNGKEFETVLGSDGKLYDLKEPITYPENFVNEDIESIGNNLNSDSHEIEVTYKNGATIKFNYQTGEVISSSEGESTEQIGLFDYIKEKISDIGNSTSDELSSGITTKYEASKELQTKLEEISVEEVLEKQDSSTETEALAEDDTATKNKVTNNSLKENKYMSVYDGEIDDYRIYKEEELLDTSKGEVVSENEKIEANNLSDYYASEGKTRNTKMGIVWIVISIIGVGIILIILKKNLRKKA